MPKTSIVIRPDGWPFNSAMAMNVPPGDAGVPHAIAAMRAMVHDSQDSPALKDFTTVTNRFTSRTPLALYAFITDRFTFARDPEGVEALRTPDQMLDNIARTGRHVGDCDEIAIFACAVLTAKKLPCAFVVMSTAANKRYHHVFYAVGHGPIERLTPYNPQDRTPPGQWPRAARMKAFDV